MIVHADRFLLAKNIRFLRNRRKLSRLRFAQFVNMSGNELYCIEYEMNDGIRWNALKNISDVYGLSTEEILSENLEMKYRGKRFHYNRKD